MQARYQYGNLTLRKRKKGPDVWQFRWLENGRSKSMLIGTVEKYANQSDAERAVERLRIKINARNPQQHFQSVTVGALIDRFENEYVPKRCRKLTRKTYHSLFENHIRPKWGSEFVGDVRTMVVEEWLESKPHSRQVKYHVRNLMHTRYQAALRWEMVERKPIDLVRQSRRRLKRPRALTPVEFKALPAHPPNLTRPWVVTVACLGLRVSELLGLQWGDVDFESLAMNIRRSVVEGEINPTKTEASESALPLDPDLAGVLLAHKARCSCSDESAFVFAGRSGKPPWPDTVLADYVKPAAVKAGIGNIGWHTFRHTYSTLLHSLGAKPVVQKELLRHADVTTTLNLFTQAISAEKRGTTSKVVDVLWRK